MTFTPKYRIPNLKEDQHLDEGIQSYIDSINNESPKSKFDSILRSWEHLLRYTAYTFSDYNHMTSITDVRNFLKVKKVFESQFSIELKRIAGLRNKLTHEGPIDDESFKETILFNETFIDWFFSYHKKDDWRQELYEISDEYRSAIGTKDFYYITKDFWNRNKLSAPQQLDYLLKYYLKLFSSSDYLKRIVASEKTIECNSKLDIEINEEPQKLRIEEIIQLALKKSSCLIKLLGEGGVGKSTYLWQLAYRHQSDAKIFFIEKIDQRGVAGIEFIVKKLQSSSNNIILLIDNVASEENMRLTHFIETILNKFDGYRVTIVLAERTFRYHKKINEDDFRFNFDTEINIHFSNKSIKKEIFNQIFLLLLQITDNDDALIKSKDHLQKLFIDENLESISESTIRIIRELKNSKISQKGFKYSYDWDDWNKFIEQNANYKSISNLYLLVALFYRFDIKLPITFSFPKYLETSPIEINNAIGLFKYNNCPILIDKTDKGDFLRLRHEELAKWFFEDEKIQKTNAQYFFEKFIEEIRDRESSYLIRNLIENYDDCEIQDSPIALTLLNWDVCLDLFKKYIQFVEREGLSFSQEEFKVMMEISKIYFTHKRDFPEAKAYLRKVIDLETKEKPAIHARAKLAQILYSERAYEECEKFYKEVESFERDGTHALFGLSKLYYAWAFNDSSKLIQFEKTQLQISESAQTNPSFASFYYDFIKNKKDSLLDVEFLKRTFKNYVKVLMSLAQKQLKFRFFNQAENLLLFAINEYPNDLYVRNLIGKFYIDKSEKFEHLEKELLNEAIKYLNQSIKIEKYNPHTYTLLGKALINLSDFNEAEKVLINGCGLFPENLPPRNELGRLYRIWAYREYYRDYSMREVLLKKSLQEFEMCQKIDPTHLHSKTELAMTLDNLGKFYFSKGVSLKKNKKENQAEICFLKSTGYCEKAISILTETLKVSEKFIGTYRINDFKSPYTILGKIYNRLNRKAEAYEILSKAYKLFPNNFESNVELLDLLGKLITNSNADKLDELKRVFYKLIAGKITLFQRLTICETLAKYNFKDIVLQFLEKLDLYRILLPLNYTQILNCYVSMKEYDKGFSILKQFGTPDSYTKALARKIKAFYGSSKQNDSYTEQLNFISKFIGK